MSDRAINLDKEPSVTRMGQLMFSFALIVAATLLLPALAARPVAAAQHDLRHVDRSPLYHRTGRNVLAGFRNMYNPHVIHRPDAPYPYQMWLFGWAARDTNPNYPGCDAIYHAHARDLDHWQIYAGPGRWDDGNNSAAWVPVLTAQAKFYDAWHNGDPSVVYHDGDYHMAYSATGPDLDGKPFASPGDADGDILCVMGATSPDGITWQRSPRPLLIYQPEIGKPGDPNNNDAVDYGMYHRPSLMREPDRWRIWFDYWVPGKGVCMGLAESTGHFLDPNAWRVIRAGRHPCLNEWPNPDVIKLDGQYISFADPSGYGVGWPSRKIAEAVSPDGIDWKPVGYLPPDPDTPACHVPEAFVLGTGPSRRIILFYACQIGGKPYDYRYNRIRYASRPVPQPTR